jgi:hypothetical protein
MAANYLTETLGDLIAENRRIRKDLSETALVRGRLVSERYRIANEVGKVEPRARIRIEVALRTAAQPPVGDSSGPAILTI